MSARTFHLSDPSRDPSFNTKPPTMNQDHFIQLELLEFHSSFIVVFFLPQLLLLHGYVKVEFQKCETVPNLSSQKQLSGRLPSHRVKCATIWPAYAPDLGNLLCHPARAWSKPSWPSVQNVQQLHKMQDGTVEPG